MELVSVFVVIATMLGLMFLWQCLGVSFAVRYFGQTYLTIPASAVLGLLLFFTPVMALNLILHSFHYALAITLLLCLVWLYIRLSAKDFRTVLFSRENLYTYLFMATALFLWIPLHVVTAGGNIGVPIEFYSWVDTFISIGHSLRVGNIAIFIEQQDYIPPMAQNFGHAASAAIIMAISKVFAPQLVLCIFHGCCSLLLAMVIFGICLRKFSPLSAAVGMLFVLLYSPAISVLSIMVIDCGFFSVGTLGAIEVIIGIAAGIVLYLYFITVLKEREYKLNFSDGLIIASASYSLCFFSPQALFFVGISAAFLSLFEFSISRQRKRFAITIHSILLHIRIPVSILIGLACSTVSGGMLLLPFFKRGYAVSGLLTFEASSLGLRPFGFNAYIPALNRWPVASFEENMWETWYYLGYEILALFIVLVLGCVFFASRRARTARLPFFEADTQNTVSSYIIVTFLIFMSLGLFFNGFVNQQTVWAVTRFNLFGIAASSFVFLYLAAACARKGPLITAPIVLLLFIMCIPAMSDGFDRILSLANRKAIVSSGFWRGDGLHNLFYSNSSTRN